MLAQISAQFHLPNLIPNTWSQPVVWLSDIFPKDAILWNNNIRRCNKILDSLVIHKIAIGI